MYVLLLLLLGSCFSCPYLLVSSISVLYDELHAFELNLPLTMQGDSKGKNLSPLLGYSSFHSIVDPSGCPGDRYLTAIFCAISSGDEQACLLGHICCCNTG